MNPPKGVFTWRFVVKLNYLTLSFPERSASHEISVDVLLFWALRDSI